MRIMAVVVTYNRKSLLMECIDAILSQTKKVDRIILIDNASTDGTQQAVMERGYLDNGIIDYRLMDINLGGAGGFYEGVKIAMASGADWIWIMDDDTIPRPESLNAMISKAERVPNASYFASCVVGSKGEPMNVPTIDTRKSLNGYPDWYLNFYEGMIKIEAATFVSLLLNGKAISKCGLPCKELFIWGDDTEYTRRLTQYAGSAYLVADSWVCHKRNNAKSLDISNESDVNRINNYHYMVRNSLIYNARYNGKIAALKRFATWELDAIKLLLRDRLGLKKFIIIQKGIGEFFVQYKEFCQRIDSELQEGIP